jgi:hypothetical protein
MSEKPEEIDAEVLVPGDEGATSTYRSRLERTDQNLMARPPTISGYETLGELGHGGMGVVIEPSRYLSTVSSPSK